MLFYIFRHGQTDGNLIKIVQGSGVDIPLNQTGEEQAEALGEIFSLLKFPVIYSSKMLRARQTAQIVASACKATVVPVDGLEEVHFGEAEHMLLDDAHAKFADILAIIHDLNNPLCFDTKIPGGETVNDSLTRSLDALRKIKEASSEKRVAVATHGALMYNLYLHFFGLPRQFSNCEYFVVDL